MIEELSRRIWSHVRFHEESGALRRHLLQSRYVLKEDSRYDEASLRRLLQSAAVLAASSKREHREVAYQIATAASELEADQLPGVPYLLLTVLNRMGNFPAASFARQKFGLEEQRLPVRVVAETAIREEANSIRWDDQQVSLTDFQRQLWSELITGESVGISAPTSAGKSFIFQAYARKLLSENKAKNIAFLVPTRALINQVSDDVSIWLQNSKLDVDLVTTPIPGDTSLPTRGVFVVTQERMQLLQAAHTQLSFEIMLVDEAQSISDGSRGVLLSSVIEEALRRNAKMQLLFAGPNIHDPGKISALFGKKPRSVRTDEAAVVQNIIFVDCIPEKPKAAKLAFLSGGTRVDLGTIECDQPLTDHRSKLTNLALHLGGGGQNLIYALGPKECEDIAFGLSDDRKELDSAGLKDLSEFIKEAIHPKYQLAANVLRGVGFHYGRLPSLVRKAIEDSFANGDLQYLATTSTLLYGVNLPAQNLFLHTPQKGLNQPISAIDFWNLAGRAGRLGKEFTGNIFLIDYEKWDSDPIQGDKDQYVKPAIQDHVVDRTTELIAYIDDFDRVPDRRKPDELETTFVKLVRDHLDGRLDETLDKIGLTNDNPDRDRLVEGLVRSVEKTNIKRETLIASPAVSIHRLQSLYERLTRSLNKEGPAYIIPKYPLDPDAYMSYVAAIKRCHDAVLKFPKNEKSHLYFALIALRWMRGEPLPKIIDAGFDYKLKKGQNPNIASVIRETLNEVERDLRFKYVRLFSCYNAVLELVLRDNKLDDLVGSIPSIPMYLEVGACSPTMISFMGIGLSRYTAGKLQALPRRSDMSQSDARSWILRHDINSLNLPNASIQEIRRIVFAH
jgi:DEAD/DEAH box helicase